MRNALFQASEAFAHVLTGHVQRSEVGELHVERALGCPSTRVVVFLQTQLVYPYLARLLLCREVAYTHHHGLNFAQRGITHHGNGVVGLVGVGIRVGPVISVERGVLGLGLVAGFLHLGENVECHVEHIVLGPNRTAVVRRIAVVASGGREVERDKILVVVVLVVAAQSNEHGQFLIFQVGHVGLVGIGMHKHLQTLILAQVE